MLRQSFLILATGLVSGTVGAFVAGRYMAAGSTAPPPAATTHTPQPVIVPPGWSDTLSGRLSEVEKQLAVRRADGPSGEVATPSGDTPAPGHAGPRAEERAEHYQKELAHQAHLLDEHEREPVDGRWSSGQEQNVRQALALRTAADAPHPDALDVDCRSKTCLARLVFRSPMDGLRYLHSQQVPMPEGCHGLNSTPSPPAGNGRYDLPILYNCRR